ncbi:PfkB family carbohydrate kinase [Marinitoga sp. 1155]|uniref:PfkB family carbohydrate kinase n=1 Tax=Marinitoga sp. 1155 TaxID=1428448 RepID=UPI0006583DF8|nr:PfkB family carbohydrate kinase [Marinitoga sp. 1155]KLO24767.1 hypothetical protein X274_02035 [Marinitoga sp. 1155]
MILYVWIKIKIYQKEFVLKKKAGGAPANVAAVVSLLGGESSILGNVGNDS